MPRNNSARKHLNPQFTSDSPPPPPLVPPPHKSGSNRRRTQWRNVICKTTRTCAFPTDGLFARSLFRLPHAFSTRPACASAGVKRVLRKNRVRLQPVQLSRRMALASVISRHTKHRRRRNDAVACRKSGRSDFICALADRTAAVPVLGGLFTYDIRLWVSSSANHNRH